MKILFINSLYAPHVVGGAEISLRLLAEGLRKAGVAPVVLSTGDHVGQAEIAGVKVYYVKTRNLYWLLEAKRHPPAVRAAWHLIDACNPFIAGMLRDVVQSERPDVVHTHNLAGWSTHTWSVAKSLGLPVVHTLRDLYLLCNKSTMYKRGANCRDQCPVCRFLSRAKRRAAHHVDAAVGVSRFVLDRHTEQAFFPTHTRKVHIPNPVAARRVKKPGSTRDNGLVLGFVGALAPHKGIELLLECFSRRRDDLVLHVYGKGFTAAYEAQLVNRFASRQVQFCGWKAPDEIFATIDVLVVPSLCHETFGRVVVDAYAAGIPVIASDRGGLAELVDPGSTGFLFNPDRPEELNWRIDLFVHDRELAPGLSKQCRDRTRQYDTATVVRQHMDLYSAVLK